ncbi:hypothetical protein VL09_11030, partial [Bacillus stratosphericus]
QRMRGFVYPLKRQRLLTFFYKKGLLASKVCYNLTHNTLSLKSVWVIKNFFVTIPKSLFIINPIIRDQK